MAVQPQPTLRSKVIWFLMYLLIFLRYRKDSVMRTPLTKGKIQIPCTNLFIAQHGNQIYGKRKIYEILSAILSIICIFNSFLLQWVKTMGNACLEIFNNGNTLYCRWKEGDIYILSTLAGIWTLANPWKFDSWIWNSYLSIVLKHPFLGWPLSSNFILTFLIRVMIYMLYQFQDLQCIIKETS